VEDVWEKLLQCGITASAGKCDRQTCTMLLEKVFFVHHKVERWFAALVPSDRWLAPEVAGPASHHKNIVILVPTRCERHPGGTCGTPRPLGDISGSPCQLWSFWGRRKKGKSYLILLLLSWALWLRWALLLVAVHENVKGFDLGFLMWLLGDIYDMESLLASPAHVGIHFARRFRTYTVLWRRGHVEEAASIKETYAKVVQEFAIKIPGGHYLESTYIATPEEVQAAKQEYSKRLRKRRRVSTSTGGEPQCWTHLLTDKQREYLATYVEMWRLKYNERPEDNMSCVFDLSQNPEKRARMSRNGVLPTIVRNSGRLWVPALGRWLLAKEVAVSLGWAICVTLMAKQVFSCNLCFCLTPAPLLYRYFILIWKCKHCVTLPSYFFVTLCKHFFRIFFPAFLSPGSFHYSDLELGPHGR